MLADPEIGMPTSESPFVDDSLAAHRAVDRSINAVPIHYHRRHRETDVVRAFSSSRS